MCNSPNPNPPRINPSSERSGRSTRPTRATSIQDVVGISDAVALTAGQYFSCALRQGGQLSCWGDNRHGQLGDGTQASSPVPVAVADGHLFESVDTGMVQTCGLDNSSAAWCWGNNAFGNLGNGSLGMVTPNPSSVYGGHTFTALSVGDLHACGCASDQTLYCWGRNESGQLGMGHMETVYIPTPVESALRCKGVWAGTNYTCATDTDDALWCWGANGYGQAAVDDFITEPEEIDQP